MSFLCYPHFGVKFCSYTMIFCDRHWGLANGLMASYWLGSRHWGLATGFPHRTFDQESQQSYHLTAGSSTQNQLLLCHHLLPQSRTVKVAHETTLCDGYTAWIKVSAEEKRYPHDHKKSYLGQKFNQPFKNKLSQLVSQS